MRVGKKVYLQLFTSLPIVVLNWFPTEYNYVL